MRVILAAAAAAFIAATPFSPALLTGGQAWAQGSKAPEGARVYFINISNGDTVSSPLLVRFGLSGMGIAPAGLEGDLTHGTGHHHLLINAELTGEALSQAIPADEQHVHFGRGQTEATITLPPGRHTLQLVLGDTAHVPHDPPVVSERISITVR